LGTALHCAAKYGTADAVRILLAAGMDPNMRTKDMDFPLSCAAYQGNKDSASALISGGATVNATREKDGMTALLWACQQGQSQVAEILVAAGANVDARDHHGYTPLHRAASYGDLGTVRVLLGNGADVNARTYPPDRAPKQQGSTPLALAKNEGIREALIASGAKWSEEERKELEKHRAQYEKQQQQFLMNREKQFNTHRERLRLAAQKRDSLRTTDLPSKPSFTWEYDWPTPDETAPWYEQIQHMDILQRTPHFVWRATARDHSMWGAHVAGPPEEIGVLSIGDDSCTTYLRQSNEVFTVHCTLKNMLWIPTHVSVYRVEERNPTKPSTATE
jgi:hypothetical protein